MADRQYKPLGTVNAPADWVLPANLELLVKRAFAHFDGTGAAGAFLPTLQVLDDAGRTVLEVPQDASVAAGSSVEASWAPFLRTIPASTPSGGATAPTVATFYRRTSGGDAAQTIGAGATANLTWAHAALPSDGSITGPIIGNAFASINIDCIAVVYLRVGWEDGAYQKAAVIGTNSRDVPADVVSSANYMVTNSPLNVDTHDWVIDAQPNAFLNGDLLHCYAINGDVIPRNIEQAWLVIHAWPATGYTGIIPRWPE